MNIITLLILAPPILIALVVHEFSHALAAYRFGDNTAKLNGRLTLNPLAHLDLMGTVMIFLVRFGWAKPVPVNPSNLKNPKQDMLWISLAGPLSNMILACISGTFLRLMHDMGVQSGSGSLAGILFYMLLYSLQINLALAVFNLLPVAPLDGSKILFGLVPKAYERYALWVERYGPPLLFGLIILSYTSRVSVFGWFIWPFVDFFSKLFTSPSLKVFE